MATINEVLDAFLGKGVRPDRATRGEGLKSKMGEYGVAQLWHGSTLMAVRHECYVAVIRNSRTAEYREKLAARIGSLNEAATALESTFLLSGLWSALQSDPPMLPSEVLTLSERWVGYGREPEPLYDPPLPQPCSGRLTFAVAVSDAEIAF